LLIRNSFEPWKSVPYNCPSLLTYIELVRWSRLGNPNENAFILTFNLCKIPELSIIKISHFENHKYYELFLFHCYIISRLYANDNFFIYQLTWWGDQLASSLIEWFCSETEKINIISKYNNAKWNSSNTVRLMCI